MHGDDVPLKEKALIFYSHFQPKPKNHGELYFFYKKQNGNKINPAQICRDKNMLKQKAHTHNLHHFVLYPYCYSALYK